MGKNKGLSLVEFLMVMVVIVTVVAIIVTFTMIAQKEKMRYNGCRKNLSVFSHGLEFYSLKHSGLYPSDLGKLLTEGYLPSLPVCLTATADYGYTVKNDYTVYTISCSGKHRDIPAGFPQWSSEDGELLAPPSEP